MKTLKRTLAIILCVCTLMTSAFTSQAYAAQEENTAASSSILVYMAELGERIRSIFTGSSNKKSDIEFTCEKEEIFEAGEYFKSCHASTLVKMSNGNILSAWFAGTAEKDPDVRIWYSVYDGNGWSEPQQIATTDAVAHWNPVLYDFGDYTRLYYKVGAEIPDWQTKYVDTYDFGKTWTEPAFLVEGDTSGGRGPVKNKCIMTSKGTLIAPASSEQGSWKAFFDLSYDGGKTWQKTDFVVAKDRFGNDVQMIQPTLWEDESGVHAMFRTKSGWIYRSDSADDGKTWSQAYATNLMNNSSGIDCVRSDNGWLWLAYNPIGIDGLRNRLVLSVSKDGGETWEDVTYIENDSWNLFAEYSYPSIIADGNSVHITYTYKRTQIKYFSVDF